MNLLKRIPDRPAANWLIMLVMATAIMMLLSRDSYLYLLGPRCDSAWFFMCGKAWMNGMVPYVDFADSKGPLLWLIYGVGYLLSHYDYHGVFWVSVVVYSFTFYFLFKTARIFLESRSQAILAVLMTSVVIFNPITHDETRAEDFGMFFTALSLWQLCRMLYAEHTERDEQTAFFSFGISLAGTLLIKYNITAMCCIFPAIGLYYLLRERHPVWRPLLACAAGFAALALPFLVYFLIQGNFSAFIQEYFINTLQTIENMNYNVSIIHKTWYSFCDMFGNRLLFRMMCIILIGSLLFSYRMKKDKVIPALMFLFFLFVTMQNSHWTYYYNSVVLFVVFTIIVWTKICQYLWITFALVVVGVLWEVKCSYASGCTILNEEEKNQIGKIELIIHENFDNPRIISCRHERGIGIESSTLPGTKYWALQAGFTEQMWNDRIDAIKNRRCDMAVIEPNDDHLDENIKLLTSSGYKRLSIIKYSTLGNIQIWKLED